jgi:hypothetical protein
MQIFRHKALLCVEFPLPLSYAHRQYPPTHVQGLLQHGSCFCLTTEIQQLAFLKLQREAVFCTTGRIAASISGTVRIELFKAQWSPFVQPSGHYLYSQWSLYVQRSGHHMYSLLVTVCKAMVTVCTAQWSPYVQPNGHYLYSQWSLYVQRSGHHMYSTVVTVCTANGHCMYRAVITICTALWSLYVQPTVTVCVAQWSLYVQPSGHYVYH